VSDDEMRSIREEFVAESREGLDRSEQALLELERGAEAAPRIAEVFRAIHSVKGSAGFLDLPRIEAISHRAESWLARARDGRAVLSSDGIEALLEAIDVLRALLAGIDASGHEPEIAVDALLARMDTLRGEGAGIAADVVIEHVEPGANEGRIRVDVALLDRVMNLVGELVLARNQIVQVAGRQHGTSMLALAQRLGAVTTELQAAVMKTRMQPIGNVLGRFPRMARELARATGKKVRLELEGRDTELDKTIVEAIQDPLTHLVRNAIDHGIEPPEERVSRGKPAEGTLSVRAFHEGGMVVIEVADDGAGIDVDAVRARAIERQVLAPDRIARLSDREALSLVFIAGVSTADRVTPISGRGVGMDVVRTNVERLGGTVDLQSTRGVGTTTRIKIPLTLAIIPALVVRCGAERFAIPQASLLEVVRVEAERVADEIEAVHGAPVFRLREKLLPLGFLDRELGLDRAEDGARSLAILVLRADDKTFGLVVDDIADTEEIVVKPLWKRLKALACYAGATVMGDGRVVLILDVLGLAQRVGVVVDGRERVVARPTAAEDAARREEQVLLCGIGGGSRLAIPLAAVARLEELPRAKVERVGSGEVAQYRGGILPLVHVGRALEERRRRPRGDDATAAPAGETIQVVVYSLEDRSVGLVVDAIHDIARVVVSLDRAHARRGVLGSMVVDERITEFLDVPAIVGIARGAAAERA
jgi:two-component system chemotaxis sensor kinase CheA